MLRIRSTLNVMAHRPERASSYLVSKNSPIKHVRFLVGYHNNHQPIISSFISKTQISPSSRIFETRRFQSEKVPGDKSTSSNSTENSSSTDNNEIILTPGEKVVAGTRLTIWAAAFVFAGACAFYIGRELFPTKMSPNSVFNSSFEIIRNHSDVTKRFGTQLKAYGRDHGGHREGRRNFVEHTEYTDKDDGSKRTRVRYNLEGQAGDAFVFAEVSSELPSGEFVYILVQDKRNGYVTTVVDNRSAMMTKRLAAGNKEGEAALATLLGVGGRK